MPSITSIAFELGCREAGAGRRHRGSRGEGQVADSPQRAERAAEAGAAAGARARLRLRTRSRESVPRPSIFDILFPARRGRLRSY